MDSVDDLSQETNKFFNYQRSLAKQQQAKQQYLQKRVTYHPVLGNLLFTTSIIQQLLGLRRFHFLNFSFDSVTTVTVRFRF